jgi:uncharacterized membrane protein
MTLSEAPRSTAANHAEQPMRLMLRVVRENIGIVILLIALAPFVGVIASQIDVSDIRFTGFDWALWSRQTWTIQVHVLSAIGALLVGIALFVNVKGRALHRTLGWTWVGLMGLTAGSSLFITGLNGNAYSLIHVLSGWTLIALPLGVMAARRHDVLKHRKTMTGLFVGGLVVAGVFTFLPGRLMFRLFFDI